MSTKPDPSIGDPVQVRKVTQDGYIWVDATVVFYNDFKIGVAYASGAREELQHHLGRWRNA